MDSVVGNRVVILPSNRVYEGRVGILFSARQIGYRYGRYRGRVF